MSENAMRDWLERHSGPARIHGNFIGGAWRQSASGATYPLYEAALAGRQLGSFADSDESDVDAAVSAADEAFRTWRNSSAMTRSGILFRFAELLEKNKEQLAFMLSAEQGKVLAESYGEVQRAANEARFNAGEAMRVDGGTLPGENGVFRAEIVRFPIGVVAAIAPWNFPVVTPVRKIAPALAYGCTVVYKPASATPWTSVKLMELLAEAGVPGGVVNLVTGSGGKVGDPLVAHPLVKGISFTGSTALGLRINETAARRLAKTQLELGGKNAALVLDYGDLHEAAGQIVSAAFACSGQRCTAISRVIVLKRQAPELIRLLVEKMSALRLGPAWTEGAQMGPLIDKRHCESVMRYIELGKQEGATLALGGTRVFPYPASGAGGQDNGVGHYNMGHRGAAGGDAEDAEQGGYYIAPTLFTDVRKPMRIAREEIFGPVLTVLEAEHLDEAVELANGTEYGLAAAVFTDSVHIAQRLAAELECGMIHLNHGTASQIHVPFGGLKQSGFGAYSIGHSNQEFFTGMKAVYVRGN